MTVSSSDKKKLLRLVSYVHIMTITLLRHRLFHLAEDRIPHFITKHKNTELQTAVFKNVIKNTLRTFEAQKGVKFKNIEPELKNNWFL